MQAEVKALQQQAQSTQASLKKLQTREAVDPVAAIVSELPTTVPGIDGAVLAVGSTLVVGLALVWWYLWRSPKGQWVDAKHSAMDSAFAPQTAQASEPASLFAKPEPNMGFDSEAAATEVIRVRKSLAEKREARFLLHEVEEPAVPLRPPEPALELDLELAPEPEPPAEPPRHAIDPWSMPGEAVHHEAVPSFDIDIHFTLPDAPDASDATPEPTPMPMPEAQPTPDQILDAIELDFNLNEPAAVEVEVDAEPAPAVNSPVVPDYATMLALAQVSEELEQLNEARDLAYEVLQSDDPALQSEARALLDRLSEVESEMGPESVRWDDLR